MNAATLRDQVHEIAEQLPPGATWDDVRYQIELRASIARGVEDISAGRVLSAEDLLREFKIGE